MINAYRAIVNYYELIKGFGDFLKREKWNEYGTITFKHPLKEKQCRSVASHFYDDLLSVDSTSKLFWVCEAHKSGSGHHIHYLSTSVANSKEVAYQVVKEKKVGNRSGIHTEKYDTTKGAVYYVTKDIVSPYASDYDIFLPA